MLYCDIIVKNKTATVPNTKDLLYSWKRVKEQLNIVKILIREAERLREYSPTQNSMPRKAFGE